jgi:NADPH:quinone reductase-like Zn-dependent oxidoreductase
MSTTTAPPTTMNALRAHTRGGPEVLVYETAPRPEPGPGEVLVAVRAAGITFAELGWDETWTRDGRDRTPTIPSHEVAGTVVALGAGVTEPAVGDEVFGLLRFDHDGAAAEYVVAPATDLAARPATVPFTVAAAAPLAALTAWQALVDHAAVQRDEEVLVHGGAGGVGGLVVQLAAALGARVTATCLGADVEHVRGLGAAVVIDVESTAFDDRPDRFDVVIDTVGGDALDRSWAVLRRGGRLVTLQKPPSAEDAERAGVVATFFIVVPDRAELVALARLIDDGRLRIPVAATYPLARGQEAYAGGATLRRAPGKTVLVVGDPEPGC